MDNIKNFIRRLIFPPKCTVCNREIDGVENDCLCRVCLEKYEREKKTACPICHMRYGSCRCRAQFASPFIDEYVGVTHYREDMVSGKLILFAKDRPNRALSDFLAHEMVQILREREIGVQVVTFVPCSEQSLRKKGFDHGEELAKALSKRLGIPMVACFWRENGTAQKQLSAEQRLDNSKKSLVVLKKSADKIKGKHVLLIDDIMTTGASALVASVHLNELGAEKIDFLCFGRR